MKQRYMVMYLMCSFSVLSGNVSINRTAHCSKVLSFSKILIIPNESSSCECQEWVCACVCVRGEKKGGWGELISPL